MDGLKILLLKAASELLPELSVLPHLVFCFLLQSNCATWLTGPFLLYTTSNRCASKAEMQVFKSQEIVQVDPNNGCVLAIQDSS